MKTSTIVDVLLFVALLLLVLHWGGVDLSQVAWDMVHALDTMPSAPQFGDAMWLADVMDAVAEIAERSLK